MEDQGRRSWNGGKIVSRRFSATLADQAVVSGSTFLMGVLLTRTLGLARYGEYVLAWTPVLLLSGLGQAMLTAPMISLVPRKPAGSRESTYASYLWLGTGFAIVSSSLLAAGAVLLSRVWGAGGSSGLPGPLALAGLAFLVQDHSRRVLFARARAIAAFVVDGVAYGGQILACFLANGGGGLSVGSVLWIGAAAFSASAALAFLLLLPRAADWRSCVATFREAWPYSKWLTAASLTQWISGNLFVVAAGSLVGTPAAGAVRAAQSIVGGTHVLFLALENFLPARAAEVMAGKGRPAMLRYVGRVSIWSGAATWLVLLVLGAAPATWLRLVYGPGLAGYGYVLAWFAFLYVLVFAGTMLRFLARTLEATSLSFACAVVTGVGALGTTFPLAGQWGIPGIMLGLTLTQAATVTYLGVGLYRILR